MTCGHKREEPYQSELNSAYLPALTLSFIYIIQNKTKSFRNIHQYPHFHSFPHITHSSLPKTSDNNISLSLSACWKNKKSKNAEVRSLHCSRVFFFYNIINHQYLYFYQHAAIFYSTLNIITIVFLHDYETTF